MSVEEVLMPRGLTVPDHRHEGAQIYFVLEGIYTETVGERRHVLPPGAAWFRSPDTRHENAVVGDGPALTLIVTVERSRFAAAGRRHVAFRELHSVLLNEVRTELLRELKRGDSTALEGWSLILLSRAQRLLCGAPSTRPPWLLDALTYMERCFRQPLSLSTVAAQVAVHPTTLAAAFRRFQRTSVGEHLRGLRLDAARQAVLYSHRAIKEIALDAGFYYQAHFGRCFKLRFGMSPAAFRASAAPARARPGSTADGGRSRRHGS